MYVFVRSRELSYSVADALCDLINSLVCVWVLGATFANLTVPPPGSGQGVKDRTIPTAYQHIPPAPHTARSAASPRDGTNRKSHHSLLLQHGD